MNRQRTQIRINLSPIEVIVIITLAIVLISALYAGITAPRPVNWRHDPFSGTTTWEDAEGRTLIQDINGNVRELSSKQETQR